MILLLALALAPRAAANDDGKIGVSTTGCGDCHGAASAEVVATLATGSTTVTAGQTVVVTLSLQSAGQLAAGLNVSASGGALGGGSNCRVAGAEITHGTPWPMTEGALVFDFTWTAPAEPGAYTLHGVGNAVDWNGEQTGDHWAFAEDLTLTVVGEGEGETAEGEETGETADSAGAEHGAGKAGGGCGCASPGSAPAALAPLGLLAALIRRRRR